MERRVSVLDRLDEVWEGVLHIVPAPSFEHARFAQQLAVAFNGPALAADSERRPSRRLAERS